MKTKNYIKKQIINSIFSPSWYNRIKLLKTIFDYKIGIEYEASYALNSLIPASSVIVDIGANMGQFACRFSKMVGESGKLFSFEPVSFNYLELSRMKKIMRMQNMQVFNFAISDFDGEGIIKVPILRNRLIVGTQSSLYLDNEIRDYIEERVEIRMLDTLVHQIGIEKVDFIKSDTEGNELRVLRGGIKLIKRDLPILYLEIEFSDPGLKEYYDLGYLPYHSPDNKIIEIITNKQFGNLILIHRNKKNRLGL